MGCRSNVFNFVSFIPFVCCLVIYKPNCNCCSEYPLNSGEWRNNRVTRALGTAHRLKEYGFHQILHLCGFIDLPFGVGRIAPSGTGEISTTWDGRALQAIAAVTHRQIRTFLFWIQLVAMSMGAFLKWTSPTPSRDTHALWFSSQCVFKQCTFLSHPTELDVLTQEGWIKASWANVQNVLNVDVISGHCMFPFAVPLLYSCCWTKRGPASLSEHCEIALLINDGHVWKSEYPNRRR